MYICAYQYKNRKSKENKPHPLNKSNINGRVKWVIDFLTRDKVCLIQLDHIWFENLCQLFDKYAVARTEQEALVESTSIFFQILWPS